MKKMNIVIRLWGCLAHVPLITIIWTGYLLYCNCHTLSLKLFIQGFAIPSTLPDKLPISPLLLTLCSIPISLGLMHFKKKSSFVYDNAESAYGFNIWLLKGYAIAFIGVLLSIWMQNVLASMCFIALIFALSLFSLAQSAMGVITALRGNVYRYWYPGQ